MSNDISTTAPAQTDPTQDPAILLDGVIYDAETLTDLESAIKGDIAGYEAGYRAFVARYRTARDAGLTETEIRTAIQDAAKKAKKNFVVQSPDAIQNIDVLADYDALDGEDPEHWVYRGDTNGGVTGLGEDEKSLSALIRSVRSPGIKADLTKEQRKVLIGKPVAKAIIAGCATKAEAIDALAAQARKIKAQADENKAEARGPKSADKYAKALRGPAASILEALDAEAVDDPAFVRDALAEVIANLTLAQKHKALAV